MKTLVNAIICRLCNSRIVSRHTHDYQTCPCGHCSIDGGLSYNKTSGEHYFDASCYSDDAHDVIRNNFEWGSYGKNGDEDLKYIKLKDMELPHIQAILETQSLKEHVRKVFLDEVNHRFSNIKIKEENVK